MMGKGFTWYFQLFLSVYTLVIWQPTWAELSCKAILAESSSHHLLELAHDFPMVGAQWPTVQQCKGTCRFEATLSNLEAELSLQLGRATAIYRRPLFIHLVAKRVADVIDGNIQLESLGAYVDGVEPSEIESIIETHGLITFDAALRDAEFEDSEYFEKRFLHRIGELMLLNFEKEGISQGNRIKNGLSQFVDRHLTKANISLEARMEIAGISTPPKTFGFLKVQHNYLIDKDAPDPARTSRQWLTKKRQRLENMLKDYLDINRSLILSYVTSENDHLNEGVNLSSLKEVYKWYGRKYEYDSFHAALIVGYKTKDNGRLESLIIRNSWGPNGQLLGNFFMPIAEFHKRYRSLERYEIILLN